MEEFSQRREEILDGQVKKARPELFKKIREAFAHLEKQLDRAMHEINEKREMIETLIERK